MLGALPLAPCRRGSATLPLRRPDPIVYRSFLRAQWAPGAAIGQQLMSKANAEGNMVCARSVMISLLATSLLVLGQSLIGAQDWEADLSALIGNFSGRAVVIGIKNNTDLTLTRVAMSNSHGKFADPGAPPVKVEPHKHVGFAAVSSGAGTGVEGSATYQSGELVFKMKWNNPYVGSNSCDSNVSGPPTRFRFGSACGSGNHSTNTHEVYVSPWWKYPGCGHDIAVDRDGMA
jgi:hypothetical protein